MKILAILGSSRKKGDSYKAMEIVREHLEAKGDVEIEYIFMTDSNINICKGCQSCLKLGREKCPYNDDDVERIRTKIEKSDALIMITSVYSSQVASKLKIFIDRLSYMYHRPMFFKKDALAIAVGGGISKQTLDYMEEILGVWGFYSIFKVAIEEFYSTSEKRKEYNIGRLIKESDNFYYNIKKKKSYEPNLSRLINFNIWKNVVYNRKGFSFDRIYWKENGWDKSEYYYDTGINPLNRFIMGIVKPILSNAIKSRYIKD